MFSLSDFLIIWCSVSIPLWAGAIYLGKRIDTIAKGVERRNQTTACGKKGCNKKTKGLLRAND